MPMSDSIRILVLEDDLALLQTLNEILGDEGYHVDTCSRGDDAVALARDNHYDLVISDIRMEGMDGLGALSQVQSYQPDAGSLVVTGYASDAQSARAARLGLNGLLEKPFELSDLLGTVDRILANKREELARRHREENLLNCARWSTDWSGHLLESGGSGYPYRQLMERTRRLSHRMGLDGARAEQLALAGLWRAAQHNKQDLPAEPPPELLSLMGGLKELWDGSGPDGLQGREISLEARVLSVALAAQHEPDPKGRWPGRFDPAVLEALDEIGDPVSTSQDEGRSILELARTLGETGNFSSAKKALQEIVSEHAASPSGVEATLELAKLHRRQGDLIESRRLASRAPELASHFGPLLAARTGLESGLLLAELQDVEAALELLKESATIFADLRMSTEVALCELARTFFSGGVVQGDQLAQVAHLMTPECRAELREALSWLVPLLLRTRVDEAGKSLSRLIAQYPKSLLRCLDGLPRASREFALSLLEATPGLANEALLSSLAADPDTELRQRAQKLQSKGTGQASSPVLSLKTLGGFDVLWGDAAVPHSAWRSSKARFLLACLAARNCSADEFVLEQFWPGDVSKAKKNLYATASYLRSALKKAGMEEEILVKGPDGLCINPALNFWHDLAEIRNSGRSARLALEQGQLDQAVGYYRRVCSLYEGAYLDTCYMDWALEIRREVDDLALEAAMRLSEACLDQERHDEALEAARRAIRLDPCLQEAHAFALRCYIAQKRPAEAVRQYESCKAALAREFDAMPSIDIERLHQEARLLL